MDFIKDFGRNLFFLIVLGIVLLIFFPDIIQQILNLFGALFGPGLLILMIIVAALPKKSKR